MRILFVTSSLSSRDGYGTYSRELVKALLQKGQEVRCVVHAVAPDISVPQIKVLADPLSHMKSMRAARRAAKDIDRIAAEWKPDVIHFGVEAYASSLVCMKSRIPSVMTGHGTYSYIPHLLYWSVGRLWSLHATKIVYRRLAKIIAVSEYTRKHIVKYAGWVSANLGTKIAVIPNGVGAVEEYIHKEQSVPTALFVGAVKSRKGVREALAVVREYRSVYGPITFHIVGSCDEKTEYVQQLKKSIADESLEDSVVWESEVSEERLKELYMSADALILLAVSNDRYFEGFGLVYLEANAYGVPVVGAKGSGAEDAISPGRSGLLISAPQNAAEGAEALHALISNKEPFRIGAVEWAREHEWEKIARKYQEIYLA